MKQAEHWVPRQLGSTLGPNGTRFRVFSTEAKQVEVKLYPPGHDSTQRQMQQIASGTFELDVVGVKAGALYKFILDGEERPDPFANFLPLGVHGPAEVIDSRFDFRHRAPSTPRQRTIYELHIGTFTQEGTYAAAENRLPALVELGITTIELMPVAAFPGLWGWGYDGVAGFAPFAPYGRPEALKRLIDEAHGLGLEVLLDVVYNHFGPSGNYLSAFSARYFDPDIQTPWGQAPRFNDASMRAYVIENALYWLDTFRFDGLRFDACHQIHDSSSLHIIGELTERIRRSGGEKYFVAEDERNDPHELERMGVDAVWADDFHHVLHVLLTKEQDGYYAAYAPTLEQLARTIERGFLYEGQQFLDRGPRGQPADRVNPETFIFCLENHDQVGNRPFGSRLSHASDLDLFRAASALLLFLPMTPLLFMGQEWAASSPFCYFTDHEPELGRAVSEGRRSEFAHFKGFGKGAEVPDPQNEETYRQSQLVWSEREQTPHKEVLDLYRRLLHLRHTDTVLSQRSARSDLRVEVDGDVLVVQRRHGSAMRVLLFNLGLERALSEFFGVDELVLATAPVREGVLPARSAAIFSAREQSDAD